MNAPKRKKLDIYQEEAKTRNTSHWDWDYLTHAQIDAWMEQQHHAHVARRRRIALGTIIGVGLAIAVGLMVFHTLNLF